jgi:DNA replication initiation complex subunit (GINS family)
VGVKLSDITITYDLLFDLLRIEKSREELQKLDVNFYANVVDYINSKTTIIHSPTTPIGERELTRIQLGNVKRLLVELYDRREKKIINLAIYKIKTGSGLINTESLLPQERVFFETIHASLSKYREAILDNVLEGKAAKEVSLNVNSAPSASLASDDSCVDDASGVKSIRFIRPVPKFLGPELETYGPFEANDIASLPSKIAMVLIKKLRAEELHIGTNVMI